MSRVHALSLVVVAFAAALFGAAAGAAYVTNRDAPMMLTGDQLNKLAIVGNCPIESGAAPFANCRAQKLSGVVR